MLCALLATGCAKAGLPEGSELKVIPGGSHIVLYEKYCYKEFQNSVVDFLTGE
jgi:hypothetical protein